MKKLIILSLILLIPSALADYCSATSEICIKAQEHAFGSATPTHEELAGVKHQVTELEESVLDQSYHI